MKNTIIFILVTIFSVNFTFGQIISTTHGGNWNNPSTWVGGIVPTANDDVIINGTVVHSNKDDACRNLTVNAGKTLTTLKASLNGWTINAHGNVTNNGTIRDNDAGNRLQLMIDKNVVNNGTWTNYGVLLNGKTDQTISGTKPFSSYYIGTNNANKLIAGSDLSFDGATLVFYKKNEFVIGQGKTISFSYSDTHKRGEFMPSANTAQGVRFKGKGKVITDGKYQMNNCVFEGVELIKK